MEKMKTAALICLWLGLTTVAFGQTWQHYQLTDYASPGELRQCGSVADSLGNFHHYFIAWLGGSIEDVPMFYMRTDPYGHILTDTTRLNDFSTPHNLPIFTSVVGDGANSWCVFADWNLTTLQRGLYLAGRGLIGRESQETRFLGSPGGGEGPPSWDLSAAYRPQDSTIHVVGNVLPFYYYRFKTNGDTLIWHRQIDGVTMGVDPEIHMGPDGTPWAAMRNDRPTGGTEILLIRFGTDTSETVYRPFGNDVPTWYVHDFGIDEAYDLHFMVSSDTVDLGYIRLDSSLQVQEAHTLDSAFGGFGSMKTDSLGNCLFIWDRDPGLRWAYRRSDGTWPHPPSTISAHMTASSFSIVTMDHERFAFTCQGHLHPEELHLRLQLYTYGYPPDALQDHRIESISNEFQVYPNPTNGGLMLNGPLASVKSLAIYNVLGQRVITVESGGRLSNWGSVPIEFDGLPSGTYFLEIGTRDAVARRTIKLVR
jgi:hypothetical protein